MKQIHLLLTIIAIIICNTLSAQNYYFGKTYVGENDRFKVSLITNSDGTGYVFLVPSSPSVFDSYPYDTKTGNVYSYEYNPSRRIHMKPGAMKEIVSRVFSPEDIERYKECPYDIWSYSAVRPSDGRVIECKYEIKYGENKVILSIPPQKFVELENEIKASLVVDVPQFGKDASYLIIWEPISFKFDNSVCKPAK